MNLYQWALANEMAPHTAYRLFRLGRLPVAAHRVGKRIVIDEDQPPGPGRVVVYDAGRDRGDQAWLKALLADSTVRRVVVRPCDVIPGMLLVKAALSAQGRELVVAEPVLPRPSRSGRGTTPPPRG